MEGGDKPETLDDGEIVDEKLLEEIYYQEKHHFTLKRCLYIVVNLIVLIAAQFVTRNQNINKYIRYSVAVLFTLAMILSTIFQVNRVYKIHEIKEKSGYKYHELDYRFTSLKQTAMLAIFCMIAAILCGATGIAGGMVLGPLFLTYGMQPKVMSATNQFITLIASIAVASQFAYLGVIYWTYCALFGVITVFAAFTGIKFVSWYTEKYGRESIILIMLAFCLILAFLSIPLKFLS